MKRRNLTRQSLVSVSSVAHSSLSELLLRVNISYLAGRRFSPFFGGRGATTANTSAVRRLSVILYLIKMKYIASLDFFILNVIKSFFPLFCHTLYCCFLPR